MQPEFSGVLLKKYVVAVFVEVVVTPSHFDSFDLSWYLSFFSVSYPLG